MRSGCVLILLGEKLPRRSETGYRCDLGASSSSYVASGQKLPCRSEPANFKAKAKQAIGAIWVRPHPARQFCEKSCHVSDPFPPKCNPKPQFQTPFLQNVVRNLGFRPVSSKKWSLEACKTAVPFSWPKNDENEAFLVKNYTKKFQGAFKSFGGKGLILSFHIPHFLTSSHIWHLLTSQCQKLPRRPETGYRCDLKLPCRSETSKF